MFRVLHVGRSMNTVSRIATLHALSQSLNITFPVICVYLLGRSLAYARPFCMRHTDRVPGDTVAAVANIAAVALRC